MRTKHLMLAVMVFFSIGNAVAQEPTEVNLWQGNAPFISAMEMPLIRRKSTSIFPMPRLQRVGQSLSVPAEDTLNWP